VGTDFIITAQTYDGAACMRFQAQDYVLRKNTVVYGLHIHRPGQASLGGLIDMKLSKLAC